MAVKVTRIVLFCALAQMAFSQCLGPAYLNEGIAASYGWAGHGWSNDGLWSRGSRCGCGGPGIGITATTGGGLPVASASAIPPVGVAVASENVYEGILAAAGELPFVGTIGVEGVLPTAGAGAVNYGCGNGATAMVSDIAPGITGAYGAYGAAGIAGRYGGYGASGVSGSFGAIGSVGFASPGFFNGWAGERCGCGCGL